MTRPSYLYIVSDTPEEILATDPPEYALTNGEPNDGVYPLGKKWVNAHLVLESDAGYDQPVSGDIDVYLYHTFLQRAAYFTTVSVSEDMRCDIALPDNMLGAQYICLRRGEGWPVLALHKLPDITGAPPDYTVELTVTGDEFDAGGAVNLANWTYVDVSGTGLTIKSIVRDSASQVTIEFDPQIEWPQIELAFGSSQLVANLVVTGVAGVDPTINVELVGDTYDAIPAANAANWVFVDGGGLSFAGCVITVLDPNNVSITTTGTPTTGTFSITALSAALIVGPYDTGRLEYDVDTGVGTDIQPPYGVDITLNATISDDTIINPDIENLANWTFTMGTTGILVSAVNYIDPTHCEIETTGVVAAPGIITAQIALAALTSGAYNSGVCTYDLDTGVSVCTDAPRLTEGTLTLQAEAAAFVGGAEDSRIFTLVTDDAAASGSSESAPAGVINAQIMYEGHYGW